MKNSSDYGTETDRGHVPRTVDGTTREGFDHMARAVEDQQATRTGDGAPSLVGRLPTTTQPPGRIERAVVSPTPPGQRARKMAGVNAGEDLRRSNGAALGSSWTIVVPRPAGPPGRVRC